MKAFLSNQNTLSQIQNRLNKYAFLTKNNLPGYPDALVFINLTQMHSYPDPKDYPHFYHWFILLKQFSINTIKSWLINNIPSQEDNLIKHLLSLNQKKQKQKYYSLDDYIIDQIKEDLSETRQEDFVNGFTIDIWQGKIKQNCKDIMRRQLQKLKVKMIQDVIYGQKKFQLNGDSRRCEQTLQVVERLMQYRRMEVKKRNKSRNIKKSLSSHSL